MDHTSLGGTVRTRRLAKERLVNAGTVIGLDEQLMQAPYKCTYVTASFVHLFFFDKTQVQRCSGEGAGGCTLFVHSRSLEIVDPQGGGGAVVVLKVL